MILSSAAMVGIVQWTTHGLKKALENDLKVLWHEQDESISRLRIELERDVQTLSDELELESE